MCLVRTGRCCSFWPAGCSPAWAMPHSGYTSPLTLRAAPCLRRPSPAPILCVCRWPSAAPSCAAWTSPCRAGRQACCLGRMRISWASWRSSLWPPTARCWRWVGGLAWPGFLWCIPSQQPGSRHSPLHAANLGSGLPGRHARWSGSRSSPCCALTTSDMCCSLPAA